MTRSMILRQKWKRRLKRAKVFVWISESLEAGKMNMYGCIVYLFVNRFALVNPVERCYLCNSPLFNRAFYIFPCQHGFHADCLTDKMYKILPARHIKRLKAIQDYMAKETNPVNQSPVGPTAKLMNTAKNVIFSTDAAIAENKQEHDLVMGKIDQLREELDDIVASECILCGETMIKSVDQPFIDDDELDVITSWAI
ncbi:hypothetical protein BCV71DRAFT_1797 [Rhizopus microsporus]|uniref:Pep3/Vps18 RING C-terminal domain-containing protein n=1 Tax=Rhizopus microsporus TaxID=58291 RepID=A0A1X0SH11_RHIZD|nr:hypothetical protein BCV71DRAFT_1797 [Rhizopus microsporus]